MRTGRGLWQRPHRTRKRTILITCEGQKTERNYLNGLKRLDAVSALFAIQIKGGEGGTRKEIAQNAVNHKKTARSKYDEYWCVFDVEHQAHSASLQQAISLLNKHGIKYWLSNPSFEVWILSHFTKTAVPFQNGDAVIAALNKHWKKAFGFEYEKADADIFRKLHGRLDAARGNSQWVLEKHHGQTSCIPNANSSNDIYRLVKYLHGDK